MDTQAVIDLTGRAADCVLRFRTIAFTPRPQIDVKSFKAAIATHTQKVVKADGYRFEVPLTDVVRYAGMAASYAVQSWNNISEKENHIEREWFRNCVCDMVSGTINDIAQKAFQYNDLNASEYIDPEDYDPFDGTEYATDSHSDGASSPSDVGLTYYGFARVASKQPTRQSRGSVDEAEQDHQQLPLRHEIADGWRAINKLGASHALSKSTADFIEETAALTQKRASPMDESDGSSPGLQVTKSRAKRPRASGSPPTAECSPSTRATSLQDSACTKRKILKAFWTNDEVEMMVKGREEGKSWDAIHAVLPRHTRNACQHKYRAIIRQRDEHEKSVGAHGEQDRVSSPGSGSQGDAEEDAVDE